MLCEDRSEYDWIVVPTKQKKSLCSGCCRRLLRFWLAVLAGTSWLTRDEGGHLLMTLLLHLVLVQKLLVFVLFDFILVEYQVDYLQ